MIFVVSSPMLAMPMQLDQAMKQQIWQNRNGASCWLSVTHCLPMMCLFLKYRSVLRQPFWHQPILKALQRFVPAIMCFLTYYLSEPASPSRAISRFLYLVRSSVKTTIIITDTGSKTLTSDTGVHGMTGTQGFGLAYPLDHYQAVDYALIVEKVSEEHGLIRRTGFDLPIGSQVRIIPVHACPVANLAREYVVLDDDQLVTWPVEAAKGSR